MVQTSKKGDIEDTEKAPSTAVDETNVSETSGETNSAKDNLTLATTKEVIASLEPLATAPASPKGKGNAKPPSHSTSSPTKHSSVVIKPKKKVTKKAATATDEAPIHATESDVVSETTELPPAVPTKRPRTKHPNVVDISETIPTTASKSAKPAGIRQSKRIKKA
ncbi:zonadhesin [Corchorus capsularis]|uniref:Zonadhesin n=1 Tax=Corchorus capsularis TaxID=210143 RepID=A0A1R3IDJ6_COCAP|nr:zonadhesin [Corchorus capsularis]